MRLIGVVLGIALAINALAFGQDDRRADQGRQETKPVCMMNLHVEDCRQKNEAHQAMVMIRGQLLPVPD
ncbi:MAG TPA: hypothetical protein VGE17_03720 [Methylophilus sp.]